MIQLSALDPLPPMTLADVVDPYPGYPQSQPEITALTVAGGIAFIGLLFGVGYLYNKWAYDDWTCMFKNCMQTSTKRR